jgi:hypothetical protein
MTQPPNQSRSLQTVLSALALLAMTIPCYAQRNSGAASVTLTAVLSQSLTFSIGPDQSANGPGLLLDQSANAHSPVNVAAHWVRGQAVVGVAVFAPGNPLLGDHGRDMVPVEFPSSKPIDAASGAFGFLRVQQKAVSPEFHFNTGDLLLPPGTASGTLTIRAQTI